MGGSSERDADPRARRGGSGGAKSQMGGGSSDARASRYGPFSAKNRPFFHFSPRENRRSSSANARSSIPFGRPDSSPKNTHRYFQLLPCDAPSARGERSKSASFGKSAETEPIFVPVSRPAPKASLNFDCGALERTLRAFQRRLVRPRSPSRRRDTSLRSRAEIRARKLGIFASDGRSGFGRRRTPSATVPIEPASNFTRGTLPPAVSGTHLSVF